MRLLAIALLVTAWVLLLFGGLIAGDSFLPKSKDAPPMWQELFIGFAILSLGWGSRVLALRMVRRSEPSSSGQRIEGGGES